MDTRLQSQLRIISHHLTCIFGGVQQLSTIKNRISTFHALRKMLHNEQAWADWQEQVVSKDNLNFETNYRNSDDYLRRMRKARGSRGPGRFFGDSCKQTEEDVTYRECLVRRSRKRHRSIMVSNLRLAGLRLWSSERLRAEQSTATVPLRGEADSSLTTDDKSQRFSGIRWRWH